MRRRPLCLLCLIWIALLLIGEAAFGTLSFDGAVPEPLRRLPAYLSDACVEGTVEQTVQRGSHAVCILRNSYLLDRGAAIPICNIEIRLPAGTRYPAGWFLAARGSLSRISGADNPGQYDAASYGNLYRRYFRMYEPALEVVRADTDVLREKTACIKERLRARIAKAFPEDCAGIMEAMLLGERGELTSSERSLFRNGGILHILAISGLHIAGVGMCCFAALRRLFYLAPLEETAERLIRRCFGIRPGTGRVPLCAAGTGSICIIGLYTVLTGMSVSAVRAFLMFSLLAAGKMTGRTYDPPTAISFAALLLLLENPLYLAAGSFQLSFLAAAAFFLFRNRGKLMTLLLVQLWMLPLTLFWFFEVPLLSVPANLLVVPLLPVVMASGIAAMLLPGARWTARPAIWILRAVGALLKVTAGVPHTVLIMGRPHGYQIFLYGALLVFFTVRTYKWRMYKRRFFLLLLVPVLLLLTARNAPAALLHLVGIPSPLRMTALSVGQGDATVLEMPDGQTVLVDGGSTTVSNPGENRILPYLRYEGLGKLDYVVVTHSDEDHVNGILEILMLMARKETPLSIRTLVLPYLQNPDERYLEVVKWAEYLNIRVIKAAAGDLFLFGCREGEQGDAGAGSGVLLNVLNPDPSLETDPPDANGQCVVLALHYRQFDALLCGDVSGPGEEQMIGRIREESFKGIPSDGTQTEERCSEPALPEGSLPGSASAEVSSSDYEVLKVAHHGSRFSTPEELLQLIRAEVAIVSSGRGNRYGHPHKELLQRLAGEGMRIERTDTVGAVTVTTDGYAYEVREYHPEK